MKSPSSSLRRAASKPESSRRPLSPQAARFQAGGTRPAARDSAPRAAHAAPTAPAAPRHRVRTLRIRTVLSFVPEGKRPGQVHYAIEGPVLLDPTQLSPALRELMFAVDFCEVEEPSASAAREAADQFLQSLGVSGDFQVENSLGHVDVGGRWIEYGGYQFPLRDRTSSDLWGQLVRADDDLWVRASVLVEEV